MADNSGQFKKGQIPHNYIGATRDCTYCGVNFLVKGQRKYRENITCSRVCAGKFANKDGGFMTGRKMSDEAKEKMRQAKLGKIGPLCPNWRGKSTENYNERRRFRDQLQQKIFMRDNYTCQICDTYGKSIQVDHIKSWSDFPELRFNMDNCRTLCMACHYYVTFKRKLPQGVVWGHNFSRRIGK